MFVVVLFYWDGVSLCVPGWPLIYCVGQGGLDSQMCSSSSWVLEVQTCTTTPGPLDYPYRKQNEQKLTKSYTGAEEMVTTSWFVLS